MICTDKQYTINGDFIIFETIIAFKFNKYFTFIKKFMIILGLFHEIIRHICIYALSIKFEATN